MSARGGRRLAGIAVAVAAVGLGLAAVHVFWVPVPELAELLTGSDVRAAAPDRTDLKSERLALVFALDGVGRDMFRALLDEGDNPVAELLGERHSERRLARGCEVPEALSVLPSTTVAAWTSALTGAPPGQSGIPGNEWFVREERRFVAIAPVSVTGHADTLRALNDGLLGDYVRVPTVYEQLGVRSHVSMMPLYRGADVYTVPNPLALGALLAACAEGVVESSTIEREVYAEVDEESLESIQEAIEEHGLPTLQVVYFPGVDLYTHGATDPERSEEEYVVEVLAPSIDRVLDLYRERAALERTSIVFVSDHGHTEVLNDDAHALGVNEPDEPTAVLEAAGFRVRGPELEESSSDFSAVVAYQGAVAYVYLADRSTCPSPGDTCDWARPPRYEEDVLVVAEAFRRAAAGEAEVDGGLVGALDLVLTRRPRPVDEEALAFGVYRGDGAVDPLPDYLRRSPRPELLRLRERIEGLSAGPGGHRAGDVMLLARSGGDVPLAERYYFSNPYRSWHGSPSASDSRITMVVAEPGDTGDRTCARVDEAIGERAPSQRDLPRLLEVLLAQ